MYDPLVPAIPEDRSLETGTPTELLQESGFKYTAEVARGLIEKRGLEVPLTVYYPGSSNDSSLTQLGEGIHTIHADPNIDEMTVTAFNKLGSAAYIEDATIWKPEDDIDIVFFINPDGILEGEVLETLELHDGALIVWASWSGTPSEIMNVPGVILDLVVTPDEMGKLIVDEQNLDDYFNPRDFTELSDEELRNFIVAVDNYMEINGLETTMTVEETYYWLQTPGVEMEYHEIGNIPLRKNGTFFVFHIHNED